MVVLTSDKDASWVPPWRFFREIELGPSGRPRTYRRDYISRRLAWEHLDVLQLWPDT